MQVINRKGELFNVDGDVVPDGCSLRTNIFMLDSGLDDVQREIAGTSRPVHFTDGIGRSHQPGHRFINSGVLQDAADAASAAIDARDMAYAELEKRSAAAWRTPVADVCNAATRAVERQAADTGQAELARDSAFAELEKRSANAWRGGR
jgi:hypothetical protein